MRRQFVRATAGLLAVGALAGCTDAGGAGNGGGSGGSGGSTSVDEWLNGTDNYDGVVDETGSGSVTVTVGPDGNELVFEPAAVRVDPGTTVTWEWAGTGHHNVVAKDGSFDSGSPVSGGTFEHTFDAPGTALYYCDPHRSLGMKGAVVVEAGGEGDSTDGR